MSQISVSFKHLDSSVTLKEKTQEKFELLNNLLDDETKVEVTYWEYDKKKVAEANVYSQGKHFFAKTYSEDFYKTLELLKNKIKTQVLKEKSKKNS